MKYLGSISDAKDLVNKEYVDARTGVKGVKGGRESSYRTGNVNLDIANIAYLGANVTGGTAGDTMTTWKNLGTGYAVVNAENQLNGQPNRWGTIINIVVGSEVQQEFWIQSNGAHYRRGGNGGTTSMPTWTPIDTTYSSKAAASGGTDVSLVTTGEKYTWNNKVPTSRKVNGKALSSDITLDVNDIDVEGDTLWTVLDDLYSTKVPTTRKVNGKALSSDITLSASDVGAAASSHTHNQTRPQAITIQTGSSAQQHITLQTLMTWLITTKGYIPSNTNCHLVLSVSWSYAGNDILQLSAHGTNYEIQLAGCQIEFIGNATNYNSGVFRLKIHTSPTDSFTVASGYTKIPTASIAEYFCNGSGYSPIWKIYTVGAHTVLKDVPSDAKFTDTTYSSKAAASGGTDVSLVTTGEKYTWDNKQDTLVSGTNIKTINNNTLLGSGNISISAGTTDYICYCECDTSGGTAAKVATRKRGAYQDADGAVYYVYFTHANTAASPTIKFNGSSSKSYTIWPAATYLWKANEVVCFVIQGTYARIISKSTASTISYGVTKLNSSTTSTSTTEAATPSAVKAVNDKIRYGTTDPASSLGSNGDIYIKYS